MASEFPKSQILLFFVQCNSFYNSKWTLQYCIILPSQTMFFIMFPYKFAKRNIRMTITHAYIVENKRHFIQAKKAEYKDTERSKTRINFVYA